MKKTDSYNKYVPLFIDNYAEQRSAKLRARMGWAGYGIYLAILQRLRSEKECVLELDYESLAFSFWTDEETLRTIIEDFGLFTINREKGCFFSPLLDEMLLSIDPALAKARNKKYAVQVPANEELASSSHACVRVNKQTNEQTNERTNEQEKEERRKTSSLLVTKKGEGRGAKVQRMTSDEENICEELSLFANSCDVRSAKKESKAKTSANQSVRRKRASVRGHLLRTPVYLNPPTVEEVAAYAKYLGYTDFQADRFVAYYAANGWKTTRHDMMNWHAAVSTWHLNQCRYAEERAQQAQQKAQEKERRELQYQQDREWRNRVFLERNASQEQQDRLFHQQRQQFLQQQVVAAVTSVRDKYELPPEVPF